MATKIKLNWKAMGWGVAASVIGLIILYNFLVPLLLITTGTNIWAYTSWIAWVVGGFVATKLSENKNYKQGAITGGVTGAIVGILSVIWAAVMISAGITDITKMPANYMFQGSVFSYVSVTLPFTALLGFIWGVIGGLIYIKTNEKKKTKRGK